MLRYNAKQNTFFLTCDDRDAAKAAGLTLSRSVRSASGGSIYFTARDGKPICNPYAVLEWYEQGDDMTRCRLAPLQYDYEMSWATEPMSSYMAPVPRDKELKPFQNAGVEYALKRRHTLIGDVPGLGKTVQAIALANAVEAQRVLVICPANLRLHWRKFVKDWSTLKYPTAYPIMRAKDGVHPGANYNIISYDLLRNPAMQRALMQEWDLLIMDEAHYVKTVDARRTQALFGTGRFAVGGGIIDNAKRMVALTGTPLLNRPRECYTLARALNWESIDWLSYDHFVYRYNPSNCWEERTGRLPELRARLRCNFMVRRHKEDVLKDLPDRTFEFVHVESTGEIKKVLAKERLIDFDPHNMFKGGYRWDSSEGAIATVRREMGEAKVPRVVEHLKYLLEIVELPKVVVFAHHRSVIAAIADAMRTYGVSVYWGGMSQSSKTDALARFIAGENKIFLGQIDSAGFGLDGLQNVCSHVVFAEPAWTPGANEQCVDRCHRIGQHDNVLAQFLVAEGSFDEMVLQAILGKARQIDEALDGRL